MNANGTRQDHAARGYIDGRAEPEIPDRNPDELALTHVPTDRNTHQTYQQKDVTRTKIAGYEDRSAGEKSSK